VAPTTNKYDVATWLQAALIATATLWVFSPAFHGTWLMDDGLYVLENPLQHDPARLWKTWFVPGSFIEYYPMEETVRWAQWQLWGPEPLGYHLTNVGLQIVNALLVWRLLAKLGLRLAWIGGLIFAVHPVQVESVAWIAELKNLLSLTPFLLAMAAWIDFEERRDARDYWLALGLFLVAMLCKISAAPFPAVILLYAWWKRGGLGWRDVKATLPFLLISIVLALLTVKTGAWFRDIQHTTPESVLIGGFGPRLVCAGTALAFYFFQFFWPVHLLPFYPQWNFDVLSPRDFIPWLAILGVVVWCWSKRQTWGRHALLGLGFFVLFLSPFLGFIGISYMIFTRVMDHFLYLPIIGLIGVTVALLETIKVRLSSPLLRAGGMGIVTGVIGALALESHAYASAFASREANNLYVIARDPSVWIAHNNLGVIYLQTGRVEEAAGQFEEAVRLNPNYAAAHNNLGNALIQSGHLQEAIGHYREAVRLNPDYAEAHNGLGNALLQAGQFAEAQAQCQEAVRLNPDYVLAYCTQGLVLAKMGRLPEALAQFETALKMSPGNPKIQQALEWLKGLQAEKK